MSTFISEPGTRLGGRYRLEDRVDAGAGWSFWKAIDETLARPVTVLTFAPGFPLVRDAVTAARAASRLTDAHLAQVFDVEEDWDHAYVVMEWVSGDSLMDLLAEGPLDPAQGARIIAEAADALASAHAAGVAHLCLTPDSLRWTNGGGIKISGIGIDAALSGITAEDPALADTVALGKLLYAALTAHWPGQDWPHLPPAPEADGRPRSPRQVRAGVPAGIDGVACQALFQRPGGPPLTTPAQLADALMQVMPAPAAPPPETPAPGRGFGWEDGRHGSDPGDPYWRGGAEPPRRPRSRPTGPAERPFATRVMVSVVAVLALAAVGVGAYTLSHHSTPTTAGSTPTPHQHTSTSPVAGTQVLTPAAAHGFDPLSSPADDPSNENDNQAQFTIDGNPGTSWQTQWYSSAEFGGTKTGTGLILDMGHPVRLSSVQVTFGRIPGADVQIELGNSDARAAATLSSFTPVAQGSDLAGMHTFPVTSSATGRYVLIWFTKLPPKSRSSKRFMAEVFNVVVRGSS